MKDNNIHPNIIVVPEGEEREQRVGNLLEELMTGNFSNLVKGKVLQAQEALSPNQDSLKEIHTNVHHN